MLCRRLLALTIVLVPLLCGNPQAARAEGEIVIGAVLTLSGEGAETGQEILAGMERAVESLNEIGGVEVAGALRPVRLEVFDDQGSDRRAVALARVLVLRRSATVVIAGSRPSAGIAIAPVGGEFRVPMIDVVGLPASGPPGEAPYQFSVLPSLEDRWMPALTFAVLVRRLQATPPDGVPLGLSAGDPVLHETALRVAAAWGLSPNVDAAEDGDSVILLLDPPDKWPEDDDYGSAIVIAPNCDDAGALRQRRPTGAILCTALWQTDAALGYTETEVTAELAVLAVANAIMRGRSAFGLVLRDILALMNMQSPTGPIRFGADGRNVALVTRLYSVEADGLRELDPADPSSLWRLEP